MATTGGPKGSTSTAALPPLPAETFLFQALLKLQDEYHVPIDEIQNSIQASYSMLAEFNKVTYLSLKFTLDSINSKEIADRHRAPDAWDRRPVHGLWEHAPRH